MKKVITYGTFDLFHDGHKRLLERARSLGDYLIVGVTTASYDDVRGKLNVHQSLMERLDNVRSSGLADQIIIEEYEGQKINDIQRFSADTFAIGSDWVGKFDYLRDYCEVVYLDRTPGVSSTELREDIRGIVRLGIVGTGRIANRFVRESKYVSGVNVEGVLGRSAESAETFRARHELSFSSTDFEEFTRNVDAVYVATPHESHYAYSLRALNSGIHVLCEKPLTLSTAESTTLFEVAKSQNLVLLEGIKTAYAPGFLRMVALARSGAIGQIRNVAATFTKLAEPGTRELRKEGGGGSVTELASYPLLAIVKLLGTNAIEVKMDSLFDTSGDVDILTRISLRYENAFATATVGLGVKSEGDLVVSGTKGYIYVPAPWWKTEHFEVRFENPADSNRYYYKFEGDGLRYEIADFATLINSAGKETYKLMSGESLFIQRVIDMAPTLAPPDFELKVGRG